MLTKQEAFDKVARHLHQQGVQARDPASRKGYSKRCLYRTDDGLKCAIGALIPDEAYMPELEDAGTIGEVIRRAQSMRDLPKNHPNMPMNEACLKAVDGAGLNPRSTDFYSALQRIHDQHPPESWPKLLRQVARVHHLKLGVVNELWGNM